MLVVEKVNESVCEEKSSFKMLKLVSLLNWIRVLALSLLSLLLKLPAGNLVP